MAEGYEPVINLFESFRAMPMPVSGTDADDIKTAGVYQIPYTPSYVHFPTGDNGYMIVFNRTVSSTNIQVIQFWIGTFSGNLQYRKYRSDEGWSAWHLIQWS